MQLGWRWAFVAMAILGLVLVVLYRPVHQRREAARATSTRATPIAGATFAARQQRAPLRTPGLHPVGHLRLPRQRPPALHRRHPVRLDCRAGCNRAYGLAPDRAGVAAAGFILLMGVGMIVCGMVTDRLSAGTPEPQVDLALAYAALSLVALSIGFSLDPGTAQIVLVGLGAFFAAGTTGPTGAMVANLTPASIRATAFGTLTLANNLLGLAAGPVVTGILADRLGLATAMQIVPLMSIAAIVALVIGLRAYPASVARARRLSTD